MSASVEQIGDLPHGRSDLFACHLAPMHADWLRDTPDERARIVHGSLVFADVSGFTKLAERLAGHGTKAGAEELVEVLDATTARLLGVAAADGGQLLKFGGDAVLLLFTGRDHQARACRAAVGMRGALRGAWHLETSVGAVRLRISQGIYSGPIHFFLVGTVHRELVLAGPAATEVDRLEAEANANEILISAETAAALDPRYVGDPRGPGRLLRGSPRAAPARLMGAAVAGTVDLAVGVPLAIRRHLAAGGGDPEHRLLTVAFVRVNGLDGLLETEGLDRAAEALDVVVSRAQESCERYDVTFLGTDVYHDGAKLFLAGGAPLAAGRDEERVLRVVREVVEFESPLVVRAGVNRGPTFVHAIGPPYRRTYTAMGDTTNLAARLMQHARPGTVLAVPSVVENAVSPFETQPVEPFRAKGKSKLVEAVEVHPPQAPRPAGVDVDLPLVGREDELARCDAVLAGASAGEGSVLEISGERGTGKSRLAAEVVARATGFHVASVVCDEYATDRAYHALDHLIRGALSLTSGREADQLLQVAAARLPDAVPWLPLVAEAIGVQMATTPEVERIAPAFRSARVAAIIVELLRAAAPQPLLFLIEDSQWLDDASADVVQRLAVETPSRAWLILLTTPEPAADGDGPADGCPWRQRTRIHLGPLDEGAVRQLAAGAVSSLLPHVATTIVERAGGNPLYLLQLARAAAATGSAGALPDRIETAINAQIDRLPPGDRSVLRTVSVLGSTFDLELARAAFCWEAPALRDDTVWDRLADFVEVVDGRRVRFRHGLVRDVSYEALPFRRRREMHAAAAATLEAQPDRDAVADLLSLHWFLAARHDHAWKWSLVAAEHAARIAATCEAMRLYSRAIESAAHIELDQRRVAEASEALGDVADLAGDFDRAARAYADARRVLAEDPARHAELLRKEGWVRERTGRYELARRWYRRGLKVCQEATSTPAPALETARHRLELSVAAAFAWEGRYDRAIASALSVAEARGHVEPTERARAFYVLDWAYTDLGSPEADRYRALALPIFEELGDLVGQANVLNNLGVDAYYEGRWDGAVDLWCRSRTARQQAGDLVQAAVADANIAEVLSDQGHLDEAAGQFRQALDVFEGANYQAGIALTTSNLGRVAARRGDLAVAGRLLADAVDRFEAIGAGRYALETRVRIAEAHVIAGDGHAAAAICDAVLAQATDRSGTTILEAFARRVLAYALAQLDRWTEAETSCLASIDLAAGAGATYEHAAGLAARLHLLEASGLDDAGVRMELDALLAELAVVQMPRPPLDALARSTR